MRFEERKLVHTDGIEDEGGGGGGSSAASSQDSMETLLTALCSNFTAVLQPSINKFARVDKTRTSGPPAARGRPTKLL